MFIMNSQVVAPLLSFLAVLVFMPLARLIALRAGFVDTPDSRKQHDGLVPPVGGLVIFPVFMMAMILSGESISKLWPLFSSLCLLLVTGAVDDRFHINPWVKFFIQILVAVIVILFGDLQLHQLGNMFGFGTLWLGFMWFPFSLAAVVLLINAINLMDGLDGLAGGVSFVAFGWLMVASVLAGDKVAVMQLALLLAVLAGFLVYNMRTPWRKKACVFLGDAGSLGLGLTLAWYAIHLAKEEISPTLEPISVAWIIALPIIDECAQFFRRVREGRHPFSADRGHFHHHFVHAGFSAGKATASILLIVFILGGVGYGALALGVPEVVLTMIWIGFLFSHMFLSEKPDVYISFLKRF